MGNSGENSSWSSSSSWFVAPKKVNPNKHVSRALIQFWDPDCVVFAFKEFELTPTLEEICYFTSLNQSGKKFLRYLGLKNEKKLRCFEHNWVSLDYLYERYGRSDSYKVFRKEFPGTYVHWQARRPIAFTVALLGTLVFPPKQSHISTCICSVAHQKFFELLENVKEEKQTSLKVAIFFYKCWAMEHFHQRKNMDDICFSNTNHIDSFYDRTRRFVSPVGTDNWYGYLASRTSLQPYAPVCMLQQFGQAQVIPLRANMRVSEISFGPNFEVWLREDRNNMSPEGEQGFEDIGTTI
ncbi:hypothetical protein H5410_060063 [Solanum commersonii]|uniref:DUF7745 domain-containing protein n=1 Tax=Solanum commersonii TaxID=4109 RepID=A0A9J5W4F0_SOLCO|nr:hypothetical protein H5410_060063 [Solanum commersonii]